ncbi:MAG: KpsF/GutQ family sugar-phosphate isomerase [Oscillospiraceae bacterium]|nr:KpsF/GutQ family sugar-phosphate isomerase [Oscillospiraceae bacterium]
MDILKDARKVFDIEIAALEKTRDALDETFLEIINIITKCEGKVIITGIGKPGHIAKKIAATMASLGTPSVYLHPSEALHGDLGMVSGNDVVIIISYSGESEEIIKLLPNLKIIGAKIIAISGNKESTLVENSDIAQILPEFEEACNLRLAPTSSAAATLVYGDALAVVSSMIYGFDKDKYALFHPSGSLGKKLFFKVMDLMVTGDKIPIVYTEESLKNAIIEISKKALGVVMVTEHDGTLAGIITDGDLRRQLENNVDVYRLKAKDVMTGSPIYTYENNMAVNVLKEFIDKKITSMPVIDSNRNVVGAIVMKDILNAGIVL